MKKLIRTALTLALSLGLATTAFADDAYPNTLDWYAGSDIEGVDYIEGSGELCIAVSDLWGPGYYTEHTWNFWSVVRPGTTFTAKNTATASDDCYGFIGIARYDKQPDGTIEDKLVATRDENGSILWDEDKIVSVDLSGKYFGTHNVDEIVYSNFLSTKAGNYGSKYSSAGDGYYWEHGGDAMPWNDWYNGEFILLYSGDEVTFTLPDGGEEDCAYLLYTITHYPEAGKYHWNSYGVLVEDFESVKTTETVATPSTQKLFVDGEEKTPTAYNIDGSNYFKLRDIAMLLNGTEAQFSIDWDDTNKAVNITTGKAYTPIGVELEGIPAGNVTPIPSTNTIYVNGEKVDLSAYLIDGANYFKVRDLAAALGFNVSWDEEAKAVLIASDEPYSDEN